MTLPTTGPISLNQVITELILPPGQISIGQTDVRTLAQKTTGQISMSDLFGKSGAGTKGNLVIGNGGAMWGYNGPGGVVGVGTFGSLTPSNMAIGTNGNIITAIVCDQSIGLVRTYVYVSGPGRPNELKTLIIRDSGGNIISNLPPFRSSSYYPATGGGNSYYLFYDSDSLPPSGSVTVSIE